jgi:hypothetical protein
VFGFLAAHRRGLFPDELFADLFPTGRGRPGVPADVMASVITLQALDRPTVSRTIRTTPSRNSRSKFRRCIATTSLRRCLYGTRGSLCGASFRNVMNRYRFASRSDKDEHGQRAKTIVEFSTQFSKTGSTRAYLCAYV